MVKIYAELIGNYKKYRIKSLYDNKLDEVQLAGAQQIGTFVKNTKSVEALIPAINNLLVQQKGLNGTQGDAVNIGNMMGKVLGGQVGALSRIGISFTDAQAKVLKYGNEQEKAAMLAKVINENVGDMNAEMAKTDQGKIQKTKNAFGDLQEEIGKKLLPLQAQFADWFFDKIPQIQTVALTFIDKFSAGIDWVVNTGFPGMVKFGGDVYDTIQSIHGFFADNWGIIEPLIAGITAAFLAYKTIAFISFVQTNALSIAMGVYNVVAGIGATVTGAFATALAILTSPVTLIIVGIGLLVAGIVLLYRNWDKVSAFLVNQWEWVKTVFSGAGEWFTGIFTIAVDGIKSVFSGIGEWFTGLWDGIVGLFKGYVNIYIKIANFLIDGLNNLQVNIPDWVPKFGGKSIGVNIKPIPELYKGTDFFKGGTALVGERGPELVNIPRGSNVQTASRTQEILNGLSTSGTSANITYAPVFNINGGDKGAIEDANSKSLDEFERLLNRVLKRRKRLAFR